MKRILFLSTSLMLSFFASVAQDTIVAKEDVHINKGTYSTNSTGNGLGNLILFGDGGNGGGWQSSIKWSGLDGFNSSISSGSRINAEITVGNVGSYGKSDLIFKTKGTNNDGVPTEKLRITSSGNIGIGTTSPDSKLTVVGHVNIGGEGNYRLRTRHVDGKHFQNSNVDDLYLNYNTGKHVRVGFGGQDSNLYVSGNMGIGTNNPKEKLQIGESYTFHDGGHKVIGFLYRPSGDIDMDNTKYGAEIRFDPTNGILGLGTSSSLTNGARSQLFINKSGSVGIGTRDTKGYRLAVVGKVVAEEVKVALYNTWPDYVFEENYELPTLKEVEIHIQEKGHLPNIPSAKKVEKEGIQLGEMNAKLLQKIEELTLYIIAQNKKTEQLQKEVALLKQKIK
ncbi:hypothetical protein AWE51_04680 [Aquimarina aggregata]|uniref:Peptidase S74 domain-containing protein n=1 Tax=Aquimarina aggregata TaxID=1642818 RepID=A0A163A465_9FLAO|nr:hypothetical protein [Aquimarina aggregata]KZS40255.1 hypothetical protein AWE51_04680 [Aquimarina aggregata]